MNAARRRRRLPPGPPRRARARGGAGACLTGLAFGPWLSSCAPHPYELDIAPLETALPDDARPDAAVCERFGRHIGTLTYQELSARRERVQEDPPTERWIRGRAAQSERQARADCLALGTVGVVRCALAVTSLDALDRCQ